VDAPDRENNAMSTILRLVQISNLLAGFTSIETACHSRAYEVSGPRTQADFPCVRNTGPDMRCNHEWPGVNAGGGVPVLITTEGGKRSILPCVSARRRGVVTEDTHSSGFAPCLSRAVMTASDAP
jgi:hypothetical protein